MIDRMTSLLTGDATPETDTDRMWIEEMNAIRDAGGFIDVPTDLPDPMSPEELAWHLSDEDDESEDPETKSILKNPPRFDWYGRDGDRDGQVQDGTPFERVSRSNSHNAIGGVRRKPIHRTRLRDMPFPFVPAPSGEVDAAPKFSSSVQDGKSLRRSIRSSTGTLGHRTPKPAVFNADAIDGNGDGTVQDGTIHERPAVPRARAARELLSAAKKRSIFSHGAKKPKGPVPAKPRKPSAGMGVSDEIRSPHTIIPKLGAIANLFKKKDFETIVEGMPHMAPFGGHRGKDDGAHPAILALRAKMEKAVEKYGPLDTTDQMHAALAKVFPNADINLNMAVHLGMNPVEDFSAADSFRFSQPNTVGQIKQTLKVSNEEARQIHQRILRAHTIGLLNLGEQYPEAASRISLLGALPHDPKDPTLALVGGDARNAGQIVLALDPVNISLVEQQILSPNELGNMDIFYAATLAGAFQPPEEKLGGTSVSSFVSDSDIDALALATVIHEWGHVTGANQAAKRMKSEVDRTGGFWKIAATNDPVKLPSDLSEPAKSLIEELISTRSQNVPAFQDAVKKIAKQPDQLHQRLQALGIPVPDDFLQQTKADYERYATQVLQQVMEGHMIINYMDRLSELTDGLHHENNPSVGALGTYGMSHPEEAAAEIFLAHQLGLDLESMIPASMGQYMHDRVKEKR
jgi:hypothetical protein